MREKHLRRLKSVYCFLTESTQSYALSAAREDQDYIRELINKEIGSTEKFIVFGLSAAHSDKRWSQERYAQLAAELIKRYRVKVVLIGDTDDSVIAEKIKDQETGCINLCGKTTLVQLAEVFKRAVFIIGNDSGPMHLASYLNKPVLMLFGPTDPIKYGPWSSEGRFIKISGGNNSDKEINWISVEHVLDVLTNKESPFLKKL